METLDPDNQLHVTDFPSFLILCRFPAVWYFKVLPVCLALTALDSAEELLDESFGFCFNCVHRDERHRAEQHVDDVVCLFFPPDLPWPFP